jgi:Protein kinase domain
MRICLELGKFGTAETLVFGPRYAMVNTCPIDFFKLGIAKRLQLCQGPVSAVAYMQSKRVMHRDLRLDNIIMTGNVDNPLMKIIDLGLGAVLAQEETHCTVWS